MKKAKDMEAETDERNILIVDDDEAVRNMMEHIVKRIQPRCSLASSAEEAYRILEKEAFDLILCDVNLPGESDIDLINRVLSDYPQTAVIMVSGEDDPKVAQKALQLGAYGYVIKPFKVNEIIINISNALRRQKLEAENRAYTVNLERVVKSRTAKLQETLEGIIKVIAQTVECRDPYTAGHQRRVAEIACAMAEEMGYPENHVKGIRMAGMIHDLGKISVPAEILSKPAILTEIEFALIKTHAQVGYDILKDIAFPWPLAEITYQHHERIDGSGYPRGLNGEEILPEARIMAVADVFEAMASHRPYRPALGIEAALEEISKNKGRVFETRAVDACKEVFRKGGFQFKPSCHVS